MWLIYKLWLRIYEQRIYICVNTSEYNHCRLNPQVRVSSKHTNTKKVLVPPNHTSACIVLVPPNHTSTCIVLVPPNHTSTWKVLLPPNHTSTWIVLVPPNHTSTWNNFSSGKLVLGFCKIIGWKCKWVRCLEAPDSSDHLLSDQLLRNLMLWAEGVLKLELFCSCT